MGAKKTWFKRSILSLGFLLLLAFAVVLMLHESRPAGVEGDAAEKLALKMLAAVNHDAWKKTGAVRWNFAGKHKLLWDRRRNFAAVQWQNKDVLIDLATQTGIAKLDRERVSGSEAGELIQSAWKKWVNGSFWLNPVSKCFDDGVTRSLVTTESGEEALMVYYSSGGLTPGDAYLWILDENGLPKSWKMWVAKIPIGGVKASWEEWHTLATGARISGLHHIAFFDLKLSDIEAAETLEQLIPDGDPFEALVHSK